jgi:hypothetical protein
MENSANFMNAYPIDRELHHLTPLLRDKREGVQRQITRAEFIRDFKMVCRAADLQYPQWGTHAFRVGGMNALQDAGASVPEIMALGHWRSDAWMTYSSQAQQTASARVGETDPTRAATKRRPQQVRHPAAYERRAVSAPMAGTSPPMAEKRCEQPRAMSRMTLTGLRTRS